jgi:hypothetical protein
VVLNTARQLGLALGVAVLVAVFAARAANVLATRGVTDADQLSRQLSGGQAHQMLAATGTTARGTLDANFHAAAVSSLQWTFLVCGIGGLIAGAAVLALLRGNDSRAPKAGGQTLPTAPAEAPVAR